MPRNKNPGGFVKVYWGQQFVNVTPHCPQNFILWGFSYLRLVHRMLPLYSFRLPRARKILSGHDLTTAGDVPDNHPR